MKTILLFSVFVLTANAADFAQAKASVDSTGTLVVSWRETGLESETGSTYLAAAGATATYWCLETGVRHPAGIALPSVVLPVDVGGFFTASKAGNLKGQLSLAPLPPPPDKDRLCPPDQYVVALHDVTYTNIVLKNTTDESSADIPGEYSALLFGLTTGQSSRPPR